MDRYKDADSKCPEHAKKWTLLTMACKEGRLDMVKYYHQERNYKLDNSKFLITASRWGHLKVVQYLVENGISFSRQYRSIMLAIRYNHVDVVEFFNKQHPELFDDFGQHLNNFISLQSLWNHCAQVNAMNEIKYGFYKESAFNKDPTIFKRIINMHLNRRDRVYEIGSCPFQQTK